MPAVRLGATSFSLGDFDPSCRLLENLKFRLNHHIRPPTMAKRTTAAATAIPATAPELRPLLFGPGATGLDVSRLSVVVVAGLEDVPPDADGNVMPALSNARTGAEAGVKSERSDSCHATEMGFANAVVPSNSSPALVKVSSFAKVLKTS